MSNPLAALLALSDEEKTSRGLQHTPAEIRQQPENWRITLDRLATLRPSLIQHLVITSHVINLGLPADIADDYLSPAYILIAQLLGLFLSIECGMRPYSPEKEPSPA